jgi:hypothetical protein
MTEKEAEKYYEEMPTAKQRKMAIKLMVENHQLKQALCAQTLGIPTGADDWIMRSVRKAEQLRECEHQLRKIIYEESELLEEVKWRTQFRECSNCMGQKTIGGESCVICGGTGLYKI